MLQDCKKVLAKVGIPVQSQDQTQNNNQFGFQLRKVPGDLVSQCDIFHLAKHIMKFIAYTHEYDISNIPIDSSGVFNDLMISLEGENEWQESQLQNVLYFAPNVNSIRRIRKRKNGQIFKPVKVGSHYEIAMAAPDVNLYLALSSLI